MDWYIAGSPSSLYEALIQKVSALGERITSLDFKSYPDGEFVYEDNQGKQPNAILIQLPYQSPNETIGSAMVASRMLNCKGICFPYLPYARSASSLTSLLDVFSVPIIALDIHQVLNNKNLVNLDPSPLIASYLNTFSHADAFVLAPDHGASIRAQNLAKLLNIPWFEAVKIRDQTICRVDLPEISQDFQRCIIVDDICDTGDTIFETIRSLQHIKINHITVFVTHLLPFKNKLLRFQLILQSINQFITTDIFNLTIDSPKFVSISVADLLLQQIRSIFER